MPVPCFQACPSQVSQALRELREQHFWHICQSRCRRVCTQAARQAESVQGPCEQLPWQAVKCSLRIPLHLLPVPRAGPGALGAGPRSRGRSGISRGQQTGEIPAGRGPGARELLLSAAGPGRAPRVSFGAAAPRAPRDGRHCQQCFTLATLGAGSFL